MNIHPAFVHFPIALLLVFSALEFFRLRKLKNNNSFVFTKGIIVVLGAIASWFTLFTGELAEEAYGNTAHSLIQMHSLFANISTYVFSVVAIIYLLKMLDLGGFYSLNISLKLKNLQSFLRKFYSFFFKYHLILLLALIGAVSIFITGALGGALVYGPDVDPLVHFVYYLFF